MSANFVEDYCRLLKAFPLKPEALYLVPTNEHAERIKMLVMTKLAQQELAPLLIDPQIFSFNDYVLRFVRRKPLTELQKQILIRRAASEIPYWRKVVQYPKVVESLSRQIAECKQYLIGPEEIQNEEFAEIFCAYEKLDYCDYEDCLSEYDETFEGTIFLEGFDEVTLLQQRIINRWGKVIKGSSGQVTAPPLKGIVLSGDNRIAEIEHIAREILKIKKSSMISWSEIALIFRQIGDYKYIIQDVFRRYAIPATIHEGVFLKDNSALQNDTEIDELIKDSQYPELKDYARESIRCLERRKEILEEILAVGGTENDYDLALTQTMVSIKERPANQVQVYDALIARQKEYKIVFVCNCVLGAWPAAINPSLILSEEERTRLKLKTLADKLDNENRLWRQTLAIAGEKLYLTYPEHGTDGKLLTPTHFFDQLEITDRRKHSLNLLPPLSDRPIPHYEAAAIRAFHRTALAELQTIRRFRVTEIEQYVKCGFVFFCRTVLGCQEKITDDYYLKRGKLVHLVLEKAFAPDPSALRQKIAPEETKDLERWRVALADFIAAEKARLQNSGRSVLSVEEPIRKDLHGVTLTGKIDRRDTGLALVDYKTGELPKTWLQLLTYALLGGAQKLEYVQVMKNKIKEMPIGPEDLKKTEEQLQTVFKEIYRGGFYQYSEGCRSCAYNYVCRLKE